MTFKALKERSKPHYYSLAIDGFLSPKSRMYLRSFFVFLASISFVSSFNSLPLYFGFSDGLFFLFIFLYLVLTLIEFFCRSNKNEGIQSRLKEKSVSNYNYIDYSLSTILYNTDDIDMTRAIFETDIGLQILSRAGIPSEECAKFVHSDRMPVLSSSLSFDVEDVDLFAYISTLYNTDKSLQIFLSTLSVTKEEFLGSVAWVQNMQEKKRRENRFWSRENLGTIPSIGTSWAYGVSSDLGKFGRSFVGLQDPMRIDIENGFRQKEVSLLENILERRSEANAIIIDDDENVSRDIVSRLLRKINLGTSLPSLEHKQIIELDTQAIIASFKDKSMLEAEFLKIFNQSIAVGNVILYINDMSGTISRLKNAGVNFASLISPYLVSPNIQVITNATNVDFHFFIETSPTLLERFERIVPDTVGIEATTVALLEQTPAIEREYGCFFTYPSILSIVKYADRFVTYGEMPGKALDLIYEMAPYSVEHGVRYILESHVSSFVSEKTGIKTGVMDEDELSKIEHLSESIHRRVVGQDEAVESITSAIRRSRSGINNPKRPISSFLFLGPTGVGKTEVSKALAESFFGDENKMIRFDMSEYNSADSLGRLIGDFAQNKSGILASKIKDSPYGVLLLDEFEKASLDVHDLFLQILDEGVFTDAFGRHVGCRNLIIIATSNAGSDYIWEYAKTGNLKDKKDEVIEKIIQAKTFRPELINRFDAVVLFHPLKETELEHVARIGLEKLSKRLQEQNIELVVNDVLLQFLVQKGSDPKFGGRSVNRAIQEIVEDLVARKIVSGEVKAGMKLEITKEELEASAG